VPFYDVIATHNEQNVKNGHCQFVRAFLSYISVKYYFNWFTIGNVIAKLKG